MSERLTFPLGAVPDARGELSWPDLDASVRQSLRLLLSTPAGGLRLHPRYGVGLQGFLHEPNDATTRRRIRDAIAEGVARWEERVALDDVRVEADPRDGAAVGVEILYRIRATGRPGRLALTLLLEDR